MIINFAKIFNIKMLSIYVLKLEQGKYYVGKTNNLAFRIDSHFNSNGSEWTKLYKPLYIQELIPDCDDYDEDKYTKIYMDKYGIDNIRGGSYTSVNLSTATKNHLTKVSNSTNNRCFKCGQSGHFAKECGNDADDDMDTSSEEEGVYYCCEYCDKEYLNKQACRNHEKRCKNKKSYSYNNCFRCGCEGHYVSNCYATYHTNGYYLN